MSVKPVKCANLAPDTMEQKLATVAFWALLRDELCGSNHSRRRQH